MPQLLWHATIGVPLVRALLGDGIPDWLGFLIAFAAITFGRPSLTRHKLRRSS